MELEKFMEAINDIGNELGLWDEGIDVCVDGVPVMDLVFDGNTTLNLILEGEDA